MRWFGESWGAPVCTRWPQAPLPEGPCAVCAELFKPGDRGVLLPFVGGPDDSPELPYHHHCLMRALGIGEGGLT